MAIKNNKPILENQLALEKHNKWIASAIPVLLIIMTVIFIVSLTAGRYAIPLDQLTTILWGKLVGGAPTWPNTVETVLFNVRIPRIICALMVGGALASSGAAYQGLFKNPMVSPDILGAASGAGFGAAVAIMLDMNTVEIELVSFLFGLIAVGITYFVSSIIGKNGGTILLLVLTGIVVQSLFTASTSAIKFIADPNNKLAEITFWLMGGLSAVSQKEVWMLLIPFVIGSIPLFLLRWKMNVLSFGEEEAQALGVNTKRIRIILILSSTLLTSACISVAGMVGWVGLVIPHLARLLVGPDHRRLIPASMLVGASFLLIVDDIARTIFTMEIPLGILTALVGAPFFLYLLMQGKRSW